jgi:hypothetical protein
LLKQNSRMPSARNITAPHAAGRAQTCGSERGPSRVQIDAAAAQSTTVSHRDVTATPEQAKQGRGSRLRRPAGKPDAATVQVRPTR